MALSPRALRLLTVALALALSPGRAQGDEPAPIALLSALEEEARPLVAALADPEAVTVLGLPFTTGRLDGRPAVVAVTGVGKVNAAMVTTLLIERFSPSAVVFSGVAGALDAELQPGDVVVAERLVQHDLVYQTDEGPVLRTARRPGGGETPIQLEADPGLLAVARRSGLLELEPADVADGSPPPRLAFGTIATGDSFVGSRLKKTELRERLGALAVEMEGAAVAQVCHQHGVPFLVVRAVSDRAGADARREARGNLALAARNAARTALAVARGLSLAAP